MLTKQVCAFRGVFFRRISEVNLASMAADTIDLSGKYYDEIKLTGPSSQIPLFT